MELACRSSSIVEAFFMHVNVLLSEVRLGYLVHIPAPIALDDVASAPEARTSFNQLVLIEINI